MTAGQVIGALSVSIMFMLSLVVGIISWFAKRVADRMDRLDAKIDSTNVRLAEAQAAVARLNKNNGHRH